MDILEKVNLRKRCNNLLDYIVRLHSLLHPELRYIQSLWVLGIIDTRWDPSDTGQLLVDRFSEEPYDTIVRILPKVIDIVNNQFPKDAKMSQKILRSNISTGLEKLNLAKGTKDFKLEPIGN